MVQEEVVHHLPAPQYQNLIIQHMDIAEPLNTLKQLLELRLQCSLADHQFYLQDSIPVWEIFNPFHIVFAILISSECDVMSSN